jgi:DNA-binding LacI/PurR family transcriptional regulator
MKTIADDLGISPMTVSNAFNRPGQLSHDLRERILQRAAELGYAGPDALARGLRRGHAGVIGVVSDTPLSYAFDDAAASAVLGGICSVVESHGLGLLLVPPRGAGPVDGLIVYSVADDEPRLTLSADAPMVIIDQPVGTSFPTVGIDDAAAAREAAGHLLALGHRRFGVVAFGLRPDGPRGLATAERLRHANYGVSRARLTGYEAALSAAGVAWDGVPVYECEGSTRAGAREAAGILRAHGVTAVLAMSDVLALGVLDAAPELSVVGFDDIPDAAAAGLTTVRQDHRAKGRRAAELLLSGDKDGVLLPYELIARRSARAPSA